MTKIGLSLFAVSLMVASGARPGMAQKKKAAATATAKTSAAGAPAASQSETEKLKGSFKWGMTPDEVIAKMVEKIEASYADRINKTAQDPAKQDRVRKEMRYETEKAKKHSMVKFEGQKSGYDVSIIDQEFTHNAQESMLVAKEDNATRYFFFAMDRLYKMFIAFDKDVLQGKQFPEFGKMMQARFGKAKEVYVDEKSKKGVTRKLDHYVWNSKGGDVLRLVDRSGFYDVYCLVIYDRDTEGRQMDARKANAKVEKKDAIVEAVTSGKADERDENDNVMDRITGNQVRKPGDEEAVGNIRVPSTSAVDRPAVKAPTPSEVNADSSSTAKPAKGKAKEEKKGKEEKPAPPPGIEL